MELENCVILDGQLSAQSEEKHIVEHSTTPLHKYYKEANTICQLIYGVLEFWPINLWLVKFHFIT